MSKRSTNKGLAVVTGGSRGIGRSCVLDLARQGYDVAFCFASRSADATEVEGELHRLGRRGYARRADVADLAQVRDFIDGARDALGPVRALVASAAIVRDTPIMTMTHDDWDRVLRVDLDGVFHACRTVIDEMVRQGRGAIVTLSSVSGLRGNAGQTNYSAAKAGVTGFSRALAQEVGRFGVRVNCVAPGFVQTEVVNELPPTMRAEAMEHIALRRLGEDEEIAKVVSFLLSDDASYITGQVLTVDGGLR